MFLMVTSVVGKSFIDENPNDPQTQPHDTPNILIYKIINFIFRFESQINSVKIEYVLSVIFQRMQPSNRKNNGNRSMRIMQFSGKSARVCL